MLSFLCANRDDTQIFDATNTPYTGQHARHRPDRTITAYELSHVIVISVRKPAIVQNLQCRSLRWHKDGDCGRDSKRGALL
jgi:hypothetical protein